MRISDWSSDVCSSDLLLDGKVERRACGCHRRMVRLLLPECVVIDHGLTQLNDVASVARSAGDALADRRARVKFLWLWEIGRASCRKECVSTCRSRWSPYH